MIARCQNTEVSFYVYNSNSENVREVAITPNPSWGGDGSMGCDIGRGILHKLPFGQVRQQAAQAEVQREQQAAIFRAEQLRLKAVAADASSVPAAAAAGGQGDGAGRGATGALLGSGLSEGVPAAAAAAASGPRDVALIRRRAVAAVVGAFVADAATMGLHWVYDMAELETLLANHSANPEFHDPPACRYYSYKSGVLSPYGDQALILLRAITGSHDGSKTFDPVYFSELLLSFSQSVRGPRRLCCCCCRWCRSRCCCWC